MTKTVLEWLLQTPGALEALAKQDCSLLFRREANAFSSIPGTPIAYWISESFGKAFEKGIPLSKIMPASVGIQTGDNSRFIRLWWEPSKQEFCTPELYSLKEGTTYYLWYAYNKGGEYRKWYGNNDCVVQWKNDGDAVKTLLEGETRHWQDYKDELKFRPMITWSRISSADPTFRYKPAGFLSDMAGFSMFPLDGFESIIAFCNSSISNAFLGFLAPTMNYMVGDVMKLPVLDSGVDEENIATRVRENIALSKCDWDSFETSWDFRSHPLV